MNSIYLFTDFKLVLYLHPAETLELGANIIALLEFEPSSPDMREADTVDVIKIEVLGEATHSEDSRGEDERVLLTAEYSETESEAEERVLLDRLEANESHLRKNEHYVCVSEDEVDSLEMTDSREAVGIDLVKIEAVERVLMKAAHSDSDVDKHDSSLTEAGDHPVSSAPPSVDVGDCAGSETPSSTDSEHSFHIDLFGDDEREAEERVLAEIEDGEPDEIGLFCLSLREPDRPVEADIPAVEGG